MGSENNLFYEEALDAQRLAADSFARNTAWTVERHEITAGRTTPTVEWRVWNPSRTCYQTFRTRRDAVAFTDGANR